MHTLQNKNAHTRNYLSRLTGAVAEEGRELARARLPQDGAVGLDLLAGALLPQRAADLLRRVAQWLLQDVACREQRIEEVDAVRYKWPVGGQEGAREDLAAGEDVL